MTLVLFYHTIALGSNDEYDIFTPETELLAWPDKTIYIDVDSASFKLATKPWEQAGLKFEFGKPGMIEYGGLNESKSNLCAWTELKWVENTLIRAIIYLNPNKIYTKNCISLVTTLTHEIGHALGILGHTKNKSIMDSNLGTGILTDDVISVIKKLYDNTL